MRILNVAQTYLPYLAEGGRPTKVRILSKKLAERGHHVTVLTAQLGSAEWPAPGAALEKTPDGWRTMIEGVEAIYLRSWWRYRALTVNPHVVGFCKSALGSFDLVHFYGLYDLLGPEVSYFCRRQRVPYVIEPMGMYRPIDRSFQLKRLWHFSLGRAFWKKAARIVATSEMEQQQLLEDGVPTEKLVIRHNGIDSVAGLSLPYSGSFRTKWGIPVDEPLLLFLGRLIPRKGADILIDAFAEACSASGWLVIAGPEGEPGYRALLEKRAQSCGAAPRVIFTGPLYDDEKWAVFADTDVFVLPSRYENFANAAAEAIASGVPVVITEACGIRSLVSGRAGLVISPEKESLTAALRKLLSDHELYSQLKAGCGEVAAQLSWDRLAKQMEGYYSDVLGRTNGLS